MTRYIGEKTIKEIFLKEINTKPDISEDSIDALNQVINKLAVFVLKKAETYRQLRKLKRLMRTDIELAYKDFLLAEIREVK